jgi:ankyrin repeat protein
MGFMGGAIRQERGALSLLDSSEESGRFPNESRHPQASPQARIDINSVHRIEEKNCGFFPATPLWYAYTRGRNEKLYKYLLKNGADPSHCWWAIAWYDDVKAGELWLKHGATLGKDPGLDELFLGTFAWKKYAFARWLVDKGAHVNARGPRGLTALMLAVKRKNEDAIKWLVSAAADPDLEGDDGTSARKIARMKGPKRIMELL